MTEQEELEQLYGKAATHAEHRVGDTVTYLDEGQRCTSEILWIVAPGEGPGTPSGVRYIVLSLGNFPIYISPAEVLDCEEGGEPILIDCVYCRGKHYRGERCPLKPNHF